MKSIFVATLLCGSVLALSAQQASVSMIDAVKPTHVTPSASSRVLKSVPRVESNTITVKSRAPRRAAEALPDGVVMLESFEGWEGKDTTWTPEGWTVETKADVERLESWTPENPQTVILPSAPDGSMYYGISVAKTHKDEWLISPEVTVGENMRLNYFLYCSPCYIYSWDNVNFNTGEFEGEKIVKATLQIYVQPEGGEWELLHDIADSYNDMTFDELVVASDGQFKPWQHELTQYEGKKVKFAFRYVGADGDSMFLDYVWVGYPLLTGVSYVEPYSTLYWGVGDGWSMPGLIPVAQHPMNTPLTWMNYSDCYDASFEWVYQDPETNSLGSHENQDEFTLSLQPNHSDLYATRNNFYQPVTLNASQDKFLPGSFMGNYLYMQAGGTAHIADKTGNSLTGNLLPFNPYDLDFTYITLEDTAAKVLNIPIFGYDELGTVDDYWLKYSTLGYDVAETDYSHLVGIGNLFMPSEAPLVIHGLTLNAWGYITSEAKIKATIYGIPVGPEGMEQDANKFETIASTMLKPEEMSAEYSDDRGYMWLPFNFDEPVVLKQEERFGAYMFMIEGFRGEGVKYFAPLQSLKPDVVGWAYALQDIDLTSHIQNYKFLKVKAINYREDVNLSGNDAYADPISSFAIGLKAEYPWLTAAKTEAVINNETPEVKIALDSYYDAADLKVEAPEGIVASVSGRYDNCVLTLKRKADADYVDGKVKVSGLAVGVELDVRHESAGINEVSAVADGAAKIYDLQGRRVQQTRKGLYIINGTKVVK